MRDSIEFTAPLHEGDAVVGYVGSTSKTALYQELGTAHSPPRSFLGQAAMGREHEIHEMMARTIYEAELASLEGLWRVLKDIAHEVKEDVEELMDTDDHEK